MGYDDDLPFRDDAEPDGDGPGHDGGEAGPVGTRPSRPPPRRPFSSAGAPQTPPHEEPESDEPEHDKRRLFERVMPEILKRVVERAVETGASRLAEGPENLRQFVHDIKLPKEVLHYLYQQIDDTKNGLYRVVAKEIRDVLDNTQFADEITKVLTKLSFEIKTEIRFIPNDAGYGRTREGTNEEGEGSGRNFPKPEVTSTVSVRDRGKRPFSTRPPGQTQANRGADAAPPPTPGRRREDT